VHALRDAGIWERFNGLLRRHARDERAWWAWLDRLAPERQRLSGHFPAAVRAALDRLEAWPDARYPFAVAEKTIRAYQPPPQPEPQEESTSRLLGAIDALFAGDAETFLAVARECAEEVNDAGVAR
jgi:hypothetical protein